MGDFSAALIAGGHSRRMGRDKAFLTWNGRPLWEHQLEKLSALGPRQLFLSCRTEQGFPPMDGVEPVPDIQPDCGPLGGIAGCLAKCQAPRLLVLGIDLPGLPAALLKELLSAPGGRGAVVERREASGAWFEPLAALYPKTMLPLAMEQIARGELALQAWIRRGVLAGQLSVRPAPPEAADWFLNANRPEDLRPAPEERLD